MSADHVNHPSSVVRRFWQYVHAGSPKECWLWRGSIAKRGGYGQLNDRGKLLKSHRLSYELNHGPIPIGSLICHRCNNPPCCNPGHLYAGTPKQNWDDTIAAGTRFVPNGARGERHHDARLDPAKVRFIRSSPAKGVELARQFGVSKSTITAIRKGRTWKNLT